MNKLFRRLATAAVLMAAAVTTGQANPGWPSYYEGVMLQGFYWDSCSDTSWSNLEASVDELSKYFNIIWIPNSGYSGGGELNMGYMPQYWFTNHNSAFGTEAQLRSMIKAYKAKGTGFIEDVVINHRNGVSNWYNFPVEEWNGQTWQIGLDGICCNDEMAYASGQPKPTGANDTGDNFDGCRDLDHTNDNVQNNCKNYCKFLLEDLGYVGFRYDMVKGYGGQFNKIYNEYSQPAFSVGEYWDSNYDNVKNWIEATGKTSAAFDFPCKYAINEAFSSGNMTKLVWNANGTTPQPAGMIHYGYPQYSVTFVDNHDTYRDGSKFTGNVPAANAFILCSPGTPCVFYPHWTQYKDELSKLIQIRKAVGVSNMSSVKVLQTTNDCYMAEVTGTYGKLVVKVGSAWVSPEGYGNDDIKASGNDYCVWAKINPTEVPENLYLMGNIKAEEPAVHWSTSNPIEMSRIGSTNSMYAEVEFTPVDNNEVCYFNFAEKKGEKWDDVNAGHRYGAFNGQDHIINLETENRYKKYVAGQNASDCKAFAVTPGKYHVTVNFDNKTVKVSKNNPNGITEIAEDVAAPIYYNLQGVRVERPGKGMYIVVRGTKATKVMF